MGPWTRAVRTVLAVAMGGLAGFLAWMVASSVVWHQLLRSHGLTHPMFEDAAMLAFMGVGALVGFALGARRAKKDYHDEG